MTTPNSWQKLSLDIQAYIREFPLWKGAPPADEDSEALFNQLALRLFELQLALNPVYAKFARRFEPSTNQSWRQIPALPIAAFKETTVSCLADTERSAAFVSSGTTQDRKSRHDHSKASLAVYEQSLTSCFEMFCGRMPAGAHWIFLTPSGNHAPHSSLAHMFETLARQFPNHSAEFLGAADPLTGDWNLTIEPLLKRLARAAEGTRPVALMGTAFHFVHLMHALLDRNQTFQLPGGSWILETGGYKGRTRVLSKSEFYEGLRLTFGIPAPNIVGEYGMCELSSQAYDVDPAAWSNHSERPKRRLFRFPPWTRFEIVCPETGRPAAEESPGLLRVFDLANIASVASLQTEDLARRYGDGFELLGRDPRREARGCSLQLAPHG